jgi:hypothetical protein
VQRSRCEFEVCPLFRMAECHGRKIENRGERRRQRWAAQLDWRLLLGPGEDTKGRLAKLDAAGRLHRCDCLALHHNNRLWPELVRLGDDDLGETGTVTQDDERQSTKVALRMYPPGQRDVLADMGRQLGRQDSHRDPSSHLLHCIDAATASALFRSTAASSR